ncbi:hypothetical protein [Sulfodiicoccus acidiphilus]|uniref:hypothetical protein n=1 Tax=Sulfodiicoccus acidiphilus TaxID=1670455 RepID=UPI000F8452A5|nr:hypothetical protein [Sulfodiicoccus acidiphilus]
MDLRELLSLLRVPRTRWEVSRRAGKRAVKLLDFLVLTGAVERRGRYYVFTDRFPVVYLDVEAREREGSLEVHTSYLTLSPFGELKIFGVVKGFTGPVEVTSSGEGRTSYVIRGLSPVSTVPYTCVETWYPSLRVRVISKGPGDVVPFKGAHRYYAVVGYEVTERPTWRFAPPGVYGVVHGGTEGL